MCGCRNIFSDILEIMSQILVNIICKYSQPFIEELCSSLPIANSRLLLIKINYLNLLTHWLQLNIPKFIHVFNPLRLLIYLTYQYLH